MVTKIIDEFSGLEKAWERASKRREAKKLCANCSCKNPRPDDAIYCLGCAQYNREKANRWYALKKEKKSLEQKPNDKL